MDASIRHRLAATILSLASLGCIGSASDAPTTEPKPELIDVGGPAPEVFRCDPTARPEELPLPRLSRTQLQNTLQFAIRLALPADASTIWNKVAPAFAQYPQDQRRPAPGDLRGGYARTDQAIQQAQIDAAYATGIAIGQELTASSARMTSMLGTCATDASATNDRNCLESFVNSWGSRLLRAPLSPADVTYYADIAGTTPVLPAAVADVIATLLNAPQVLYRVEHGADIAAEPAPLSAFELASRLSYLYWQAPPDDQLWAAAVSGALLEPVTYRAQLARLEQSPNARPTVDELISQWLRLDELPPLDALKSDPIFQAFAGAQLPPATARDAMLDDVLTSARSAVMSGGTLSDFLNDRHAYATDGYLAGIYQVAPWDGAGAAPLFSSAKRSGLLTRAGLLATGTATTRPIHKGYLVRNALLCQPVGAPPPNVSAMPPVSTSSQTTRQVVTQLTSAGSCSGCHATQINPPGFLTENFDALGRERAEERLFDAAGKVVAQLPVDTTAVPQVTSGDLREMSDAAELTRVIDESRLFHSCFARHYFRFSQSRNESPGGDGCLLSALEASARSGAPILEVLRTVPEAPVFKERSFQ
jgi:hypothetical protein